MRTRPGNWRQLLVFGAFLALLWPAMTATIELGFAVPSTARFSGFEDRSSLDLARPATAFEPLSAAFIDRVLGRDVVAHNSLAGVQPRGQTKAKGAAGVTIRHAFTNDKFADAYEIAAVPFGASTNAASATREPSEPGSCARVGGTAWYRYRAARSGRLIADTFGTDRADSLAVFSGTEMANLQHVGCNTGPTGNAQVAFPADKGTTYYFQVTQPAGGKDLAFHLTQIATTRPVSVSPSGAAGNGAADTLYRPAITPDARYVAFQSYATNLDPGRGHATVCRPNGDWEGEDGLGATGPYGGPCRQIYVYDRTTGRSEMVSVTPAGQAGNNTSAYPSISDDGRYVAFMSYASDLGPGTATPNPGRVVVRDRLTGTTQLVDPPINDFSCGPVNAATLGALHTTAISGSGRYVVFEFLGADCFFHLGFKDAVTGTLTRLDDQAPVFVGSRENVEALTPDGAYVLFDSTAVRKGCTAPPASSGGSGCVELYRWQPSTGRVDFVGTNKAGVEPQRGTTLLSGSISPDGRYIGFESDSGNLVDGDTNQARDAFWRDLRTGETRRVSVSSEGGQPSGNADQTGGYGSAIVSADGTTVDFESAEGGLTPQFPTSNGSVQLYRHSIVTGATTLLSVAPDGSPGDSDSYSPVSAHDGAVIAFVSLAANLGAGTCRGLPEADAVPGAVPRPAVLGTSINQCAQVILRVEPT